MHGKSRCSRRRRGFTAKTSPPFTLALFNYVSLDGIASPPVLCGNWRTCARLNCVYDCPRPACRVPPASAVSNCYAARKRRDETRQNGMGRETRDAGRRDATPRDAMRATDWHLRLHNIYSQNREPRFPPMSARTPGRPRRELPYTLSR